MVEVMVMVKVMVIVILLILRNNRPPSLREGRGFFDSTRPATCMFLLPLRTGL